MQKIGDNPKAGFNRIKSVVPKKKGEDIYEILPFDKTLPYDTYQIIDCLVDKNSIEEYKSDYGKTMITAYARINGWAVGIVANQRKMVKNREVKPSLAASFMGMRPTNPPVYCQL